jgi:thiol:disulfide interchange protein DsbA
MHPMLKNGLMLSLFTICSPIFAQENLLDTGKATGVDPRTSQKVDVQIFGRSNVQNEFNVVRFFFTYTCDHGEKYDAEMSVWGSTLPTKFKYVRVPVVTQEPNSTVGAFAYYAAYQTDKSKINHFQQHAFNLIKHQRKDPSDQWTYYEAAKRAGLDLVTFKKHWGTKRTVLLVKNAVILGAKYKVEYTPTLTVGGIYTLNPEPIAESKTSFIDFANAITSKYISENGVAIR